MEESDQSGTAVLEVKIPTGYYIYQPKLNKYVQSKEVPNLKYARYAGDKVVLYFDYVSIIIAKSLLLSLVLNAIRSER